MLAPRTHLPWAGHSARHAIGEIYALIKRHKTALVFVNTRSQAELTFQELWRHQRRQPADRAASRLARRGAAPQGRGGDGRGQAARRGCTSTLDLGIDWGDVDLVDQCRRAQGRVAAGAAHRPRQSPARRALRALLVPANRFEVLECRAAAMRWPSGALDTPPLRTGALDVLAQHVLGMAVRRAVLPDELYAEVRSAAPYAALTRADFDGVVDFVATGGYALRPYERFAKIRARQGWPLAHRPSARRAALPPERRHHRRGRMLKVRLVRSRGQGAIVPRAAAGCSARSRNISRALTPGDTFVFAGEILRFEGLVEDEAYVSRAHRDRPKVPSYEGGKFPLSTYLAARVRAMLAQPRAGAPARSGARMARIQQWRSLLPEPGELLVETFPRARQVLSRLLSVRGPAGAPDARHAADAAAGARAAAAARLRRQRICAGGVGPRRSRPAHPRGELSLAQLFDEDMLGDDLEAWLAESALMKRTFRNCAIIAGLIERRFPARRNRPPGDVFHRPDLRRAARAPARPHLLRAARADAATGLLDITRLGEMLARIRGRIVHKALDHVSPLAVPVMLEIGRETVYGEASDALLAEAADELVKEAMR